MTTPHAAPYRLSLVGAWALIGPDGRHVQSVLSQPKRLCLLAYLALAARPVSRSTVVSLFWPESDEERARNALSQAVHYLRRSLSKDAVQSLEGDRLLVSAEMVWFDARVLLEGKAGPDGAAVVEQGSADGSAREGARERRAIADRAVQGAEFFEGWNADDAQPLQEWLDGVRREVRARAAEVLEGDAGESAGAGTAGAAESGAAEVRDPEGSGAGAAGAGRATDPDDRAPASRRRDGEVMGADAPSAPGATAPPDSAGRRRWLLRALAAAALVAVLIAGIVRSGARAETDVLDVAILMPQIAATDSVHPLSAEAVHAELVAHLGGIDGIRIRSLPFAESAFDLRRFLDALGDVGAPDVVLTVNARVAGGEVRVVGLLLGGPDYTEALGTSAATHRFATDADALLALPQEIAIHIVDELDGSLSGGAR